MSENIDNDQYVIWKDYKNDFIWRNN
jgi:hypothetical protein